MLSDIEYKRLHHGDALLFRELIALFGEVFGESRGCAGDSYLNTLLSKPGFFVVIALHNDRVIGGLTAYELEQYYNNRSELFVYDIAIHGEYQRKGLGRELTLDLIKQCLDTRIESIFVSVDRGDQEARRFYDQVFGMGTDVCHYTIELADWKSGRTPI